MKRNRTEKGGREQARMSRRALSRLGMHVARVTPEKRGVRDITKLSQGENYSMKHEEERIEGKTQTDFYTEDSIKRCPRQLSGGILCLVGGVIKSNQGSSWPRGREGVWVCACGQDHSPSFACFLLLLFSEKRSPCPAILLVFISLILKLVF